MPPYIPMESHTLPKLISAHPVWEFNTFLTSPHAVAQNPATSYRGSGYLSCKCGRLWKRVGNDEEDGNHRKMLMELCSSRQSRCHEKIWGSHTCGENYRMAGSSSSPRRCSFAARIAAIAASSVPALGEAALGEAALGEAGLRQLSSWARGGCGNSAPGLGEAGLRQLSSCARGGWAAATQLLG
eukprot:gene2207-biopygen11217